MLVIEYNYVIIRFDVFFFFFDVVISVLLLFCVDLLLEDSDYIVDMFLEEMDDFDFYIGIWEG